MLFINHIIHNSFLNALAPTLKPLINSYLIASIYFETEDLSFYSSFALGTLLMSNGLGLWEDFTLDDGLGLEFIYSAKSNGYNSQGLKFRFASSGDLDSKAFIMLLWVTTKTFYLLFLDF